MTENIRGENWRQKAVDLRKENERLRALRVYCACDLAGRMADLSERVAELEGKLKLKRSYINDLEARVAELENKCPRVIADLVTEKHVALARVAELEKLAAERGDRVVKLARRVEELEARVNDLGLELWWERLRGCPIDSDGWYRPESRRHALCCIELASKGKLERHPEKPWWRRKELIAERTVAGKRFDREWLGWCAEERRLKARVAELEARLEEQWWYHFESSPIMGDERKDGWRLPINSDEKAALAELERLGKLEKHESKDWWRRKGTP